MRSRRTVLFVSVAAAALSGGGSALAQDGNCTNLADTLSVEGVTVTSAEHVAAGEESPAPHCLLRAKTGERTGIDGQDYAVSFEMRLPDDWNGKFFHQLNGGNDGKVVPAIGPLLSGNKQRTALGEGYAVLSSDAGHDGEAQPEAGLAGGNRFGLDPEARAAYGYKAVQTLTPIGKEIVASYYDGEPEYSYAVGCSNGGRHGMVAAARLPEAYDGILAGAPGFNLPKAAVQHALDIQTLKGITGDVRTSFSPADMALVGDRIAEACDALDGVEDGIVSDTAACQAEFDPDTLACAEGQNEQCLSPERVEALKTIHAGPKNSAGEQLYSDWAWDTGIGSGNWRFWKIESPIPPWNNMPLIAVMGAGSLAHVFTTPPTEVAGDPDSLEQFLLDFDFDEDAPKIDAVTDTFAESAMEFMTPPGSDDPELAAFRDAGAKMILFHGVSDPVFSVNDTIDWYETLDANNEGSAGEFAKLYTVPGMAHCSGGPATDDFNLFAELVDWVENGEAPQAVTASVAEGNRDAPEGWSADRTRKLCPYPQVARYTGDDPESAESFTCE